MALWTHRLPSMHSLMTFFSTTNIKLVPTIFDNFFDTTARKIGLNMNNTKTQFHAPGSAPQATITRSTNTTLSTTTTTGSPHRYYKYLGIFLFTTPAHKVLYEEIKSQIKSFFTQLAHLQLSISQWILITSLLLKQ